MRWPQGTVWGDIEPQSPAYLTRTRAIRCPVDPEAPVDDEMVQTLRCMLGPGDWGQVGDVFNDHLPGLWFALKAPQKDNNNSLRQDALNERGAVMRLWRAGLLWATAARETNFRAHAVLSGLACLVRLTPEALEHPWVLELMWTGATSA